MSEVLKLKPEVKALWVAALRSGKYQQGREALQNNAGFCCLGVLCDLYAKENQDMAWGGITNGMLGDRAFGDAYEDEVAYPPKKVYAWAFGEYFSDDATRSVQLTETVYSDPAEYGGEEASARSLVACNDELKLDFDKIADIIEVQL